MLHLLDEKVQVNYLREWAKDHVEEGLAHLQSHDTERALRSLKAALIYVEQLEYNRKFLEKS